MKVEQGSNQSVEAAFAAARSERMHVGREAAQLDLPILRANRSAIIWCLDFKHLINRGHVRCPGCYERRKIERDLASSHGATASIHHFPLRRQRTTGEIYDTRQFRVTGPTYNHRRECRRRSLGTTLNPLYMEDMAMASDGSDPWNNNGNVNSNVVKK